MALLFSVSGKWPKYFMKGKRIKENNEKKVSLSPADLAQDLLPLIN